MVTQKVLFGVRKILFLFIFIMANAVSLKAIKAMQCPILTREYMRKLGEDGIFDAGGFDVILQTRALQSKLKRLARSNWGRGIPPNRRKENSCYYRITFSSNEIKVLNVLIREGDPSRKTHFVIFSGENKGQPNFIPKKNDKSVLLRKSIFKDFDTETEKTLMTPMFVGNASSKRKTMVCQITWNNPIRLETYNAIPLKDKSNQSFYVLFDPNNPILRGDSYSFQPGFVVSKENLEISEPNFTRKCSEAGPNFFQNLL